MARHFERKRHALPDVTITVLRPLLRYSSSRDAYVLRAVGNKTGPVITRRSSSGRFARSGDRATTGDLADGSAPRVLTPRRRS